MTKEEIKNEIEKTQKQLEALQTALSKAEEDEVPDILPFEYGEKIYCMATTGAILEESFRGDDYTDMGCALNRRYFKTRAYAEMFSEKTQFIADLLHFKYLYDRDYKPNWDSEDEQKFSVYYNNKTEQFESYFSISYSRTETVYFSTNQLAKKCADWLNKLGGRK